MQHENVTSYGATFPHSRSSTVYSVDYSPDLTPVPLDRDVDAFPALLRARLAGNTTPHATPNDSIPDFMSDASITPTATTPLVRSKVVKYSSSDDGSSYFPSPENNNLILAGEESSEPDPNTPTPLPVRQLAALLIGQLPEPVVATVLFPFINQLVLEIGITGGDERKVGYYAGIIESLFFLSEFLMVLRWGRLSDRYGRKPIILCGLMGMTVSSACFGLSKSFMALVISRSLAGLLSGNIGVMKSALGEILDPTNIAEGCAMLPVVWSAGSTIGPLIGGFLSRPHEKFPTLFDNEFWRTYPYFLPCICASFLCLTAAVIVALCFEESLPALRRKKTFEDKEYQELPHPRRLGHQRSSSEETLVETGPQQPPLSEILTPPVVVSISNYAILSLLDIALTALLPLFYSTPISNGGLGLDPATIGLVLGTLGLTNGSLQGLFSAKVQRYFGIKNVYVGGLFCFFGSWASLPLMNALARANGIDYRVITLLFFQLSMNIGSNTSFGCIMLFITAAAKEGCLGATNGVSQTMISFVRMVGPAAATSLFALSMEHNIMGGTFVYWVLVFFTFVSLAVAVPLPKRCEANFSTTSHFRSLLRTMPTFAHLLPPSWKTAVTAWLEEDTPSFDYGGYVVGEVQREAFLLGKGKSIAVLAGVPFVDEIFAQLGCTVEWHMSEGDTFEPVKKVATVRGKARHLLLGERVALNLLARCSGIATKSRYFLDTARANGFKGIIAGTRKTTPGFRLVEKYGMIVGGIDAHRHDLSSMVMLKDNHVWSVGEYNGYS
ncbi:hypothetical protein FRC00_014094 [Tulasnella sp. 408]|nr:hypothetical protein FRC00_014094 [Tulasnella sp. 408]